jgi:hypothetical protein
MTEEDQIAASLCNHAKFYCNDRERAKELALFICEVVLENRLEKEERQKWKRVCESIYKL